MGGDNMQDYITFDDLLHIAEFCVNLAILIVTTYYFHKKK